MLPRHSKIAGTPAKRTPITFAPPTPPADTPRLSVAATPPPGANPIMLNNLYFGRNPAAAEIANGVTIRWALAFEAARTGQEIQAADVKRAYADFGAKVLNKEADKIATQANALYRDMQNSFDAYKDGSDKAAGKIAELYRSDFDQAQQEAYRLGAEAGTNAARQLARESLAIAREHKKEAEAITGYSLRSLEFGLGCDIEETILVTYPDTLTKEEAERRTRIRMKAREEAIKNLEEVDRHPNADDPLIASDAERQTVEAAVRTLSAINFVAEVSGFLRNIFPQLREEYRQITGIAVGTTPNC